MKNLTTRQKYLIAGIIVMLSIGGYLLLHFKQESDIIINNESKDVINKTDIAKEQQEQEIKPPKQIIVHVSGRVKVPGIVTLNEGTRVNDALLFAGEILNDADLSGINLAAFLKDGEKIYVPKKGEIPKQFQTYIQSSSKSSNDDIVNINTASLEELDKIPQVGPSTAKRIIEYRESNGPFKNINDVKKVSGIGEKKFEKIKKYIII